MERTILTKKNCHRAAQVRLIEKPETVFDWHYNGIRVNLGVFNSEYAHLATIPNSEECTVQTHHVDSELGLFEVVSWKYGFSFEELWEKAVRAHEGTSFSPERRAESSIRQYESECLADLNELPESEREEYIRRFKEKVGELFILHSRILSPMVTGSARFPVSRNEKANKAYEKAHSAFFSWRRYYLANLKKREQLAKSPEELVNEEWLQLKKEIRKSAAVCAEIDNGNRCYHRSLFTGSISGKLERLAANGKTGIVMKALEYIKELQEDAEFGLKKPLFTTRHKIWKLQEVCVQSLQKAEERENKDEYEISVKDAKVVLNFAEDRLQIFHDSKPAFEVIAELKHNAFKWSRMNGCWQRQLTRNSIYGAARVLFGTELGNEERRNFISNLEKQLI